MNTNRLAWLDIETTGLNPNTDAILEIGIVVTNNKLEILAERSWVVFPSRDAIIHEISPKVIEMHNMNGLWLESLNSNLLLHDATEEAIKFLDAHNVRNSPACGSSVHLDRAFLKAQAPELIHTFMYRNLDVSTLKILFTMFRPDLADQFRESFPDRAHRALDDAKMSITELRFYANALGWEIEGPFYGADVLRSET